MVFFLSLSLITSRDPLQLCSTVLSAATLFFPNVQDFLQTQVIFEDDRMCCTDTAPFQIEGLSAVQGAEKPPESAAPTY